MRKKQGFTLIELLIVIAVVAILAVGAYVALDPATRLKDSRDSTRWTDVVAILDAIKVDQVDNGGSYLTAIENATAGVVYMIGTDVAGCDDDESGLDCDIASDTACVNLTGLATEGYLAAVPTSPTGSITWSAGTTGYYLTKSSTGGITVAACESENTTAISVQR